MTKGVDVPESSVQHEVRTLLELNGWRSHFLDVFCNLVEYEDRKRFFKEGVPGQADLIAVRPHYSKPFGDVGGKYLHHGQADCLYIELKRKGKKSKPHQRAWQEVARKDGFSVLADVTSWADACEKAAAIGIRLEKR